jgi:hypothetical protein
MSFRNILRKVLLCLVLGSGSILRTQMSREEIESILHSANQPRAEVTIRDENARDGPN